MLRFRITLAGGLTLAIKAKRSHKGAIPEFRRPTHIWRRLGVQGSPLTQEIDERALRRFVINWSTRSSNRTQLNFVCKKRSSQNNMYPALMPVVVASRKVAC